MWMFLFFLSSRQHSFGTTLSFTVGPFFSPDLCLYTCKEFSVHDSISYVVFQNIPVAIIVLYTVDPLRRLLHLSQSGA